MIIERNIAPYIVFSEDPIVRALGKISDNKERIVFCVGQQGHLEGSLSDGDFRRWIVATPDADLQTPAVQVAHRDVASGRFGTPTASLRAAFRPGVTHVPLVDEQHRMIAIAIDRDDELRIGAHAIGPGHPAFLIAEIGNNHQGSVDLARQLVDLAADAGADAVKFQLRDMAALYRGPQGSTAGEDLGAQYTLDLLAKFALDFDRLSIVFDHCRDRGIDVMCTPWDSPSVKALADYGIPALKIASADLTNHALLREAAGYGLPLVLSTGMSREDEIRESAALVRSTGASFALLHCQSTYPAPFKDVNLAYMDRLAQIGQCVVGYSGHERGFHVPVAAVARGAHIVEKHFTLDRSLEGNDHKVSLLPQEFAQMVARIREVEEALGSAAPREVSTGEMMNRVNLAKSLVATRAIATGETITADAVTIKSPGRGLQPNALQQLVGRVSRRDIDEGDFFYDGDLGTAQIDRREFSFRRPWGLPVRYHDFRSLVRGSNADFVEFHFSYKDLDLDLSQIFRTNVELAAAPYAFTTHTPDLFSGDFILDLASEDPAIWERSITELQRVIDITRSLHPHFTCAQDPLIVATLGGFTADAHVDPSLRERMYARVAEGLSKVDETGVRLTAQTLPPYPWLMGGQQFHNLFLDARDTAAFAQRYDRKLTLDVSHSKLAANFAGRPFSEYVDILGPHTEHLHIVDATGVDGEGVQIADGEVDFAALATQLDQLAPHAGFIPEIWQGHVGGGEGFWVALDRLEAWF
ncbi:N-acetylneuraminate synthase family protein [Allobranchiibius huperziae]|uniref:N-acetylneuraminate synthase n=1 Tax=Allobranchiibius huperziae TaxID=1874116 RepID=A0A853DK90_9MICO|nr:N-acetylneuraminate synthase family protein [Allobranchiibius huperziae]NYJ75161.1 N-acetylneuraminate synthase [Allobranchiibius huperziae]